MSNEFKLCNWGKNITSVGNISFVFVIKISYVYIVNRGKLMYDDS